MQTKLIKLAAGIICVAGMMQPVFAESGYESSNSPPSTTTDVYSSSGSGYSSSNAAPSSTTTSSYSSSADAPPSTTTTTSQYKRIKHNRFALNVTIPGTNDVVTYRVGKGIKQHHSKHYSNEDLYWVAMEPGQDVPNNAVVGGSQYNPSSTFYVCHANYHGGTHPGKYLNGNCNISWGGREVVISQGYEILVSRSSLGWTSASNGSIPDNAIEGGYEGNNPLYVCQANYRNGTHTGKIIGRNCNFGWGGKEVMSTNYNVLVG